MSDALLKLMKEKDYEEITINEIAALAGVNRSTWFRNFASKFLQLRLCMPGKDLGKKDTLCLMMPTIPATTPNQPKPTC